MSPTKPESNVCTSCEKSVTDDDSLECVWCERLQHRNCAKISDDQSISDIIDEVNSAIDKNLKTFELSLTNKFDRLSDQVQQIAKKDQLETIECQLKESMQSAWEKSQTDPGSSRSLSLRLKKKPTSCATATN